MVSMFSILSGFLLTLPNPFTRNRTICRSRRAVPSQSGFSAPSAVPWWGDFPHTWVIFFGWGLLDDFHDSRKEVPMAKHIFYSPEEAVPDRTVFLGKKNIRSWLPMCESPASNEATVKTVTDISGWQHQVATVVLSHAQVTTQSVPDSLALDPYRWNKQQH